MSIVPLARCEPPNGGDERIDVEEHDNEEVEIER